MRLKTFILSACLLLLALPAAGACSKQASSTTTAPVVKPIEIVSVTGPMPPFNPGGPNVEIVVKNVSQWPVYHLIAILDLGLQTPAVGYVFDFGLTQDNTLAPGATATLSRSLIAGGFSGDIFYTLGLDVGYTGTLGPGTSNYSVQVKIIQPPATS